jgi:O-acetyl-ADP-ribose deacetylase (regulator of RNase III)
LASCYRNSLLLAERHGIASIAFPGISTGVYGYPVEQAARIAIAELLRWQTEARAPLRLIKVAFSAPAGDIYRRVLKDL